MGPNVQYTFFSKWMFNILSGTSVTLGYSYPVHSISFNKCQIKKKKKRKKEIACVSVCVCGREFKLLNEKQRKLTISKLQTRYLEIAKILKYSIPPKSESINITPSHPLESKNTCYEVYWNNVNTLTFFPRIDLFLLNNLMVRFSKHNFFFVVCLNTQITLFSNAYVILHMKEPLLNNIWQGNLR